MPKIVSPRVEFNGLLRQGQQAARKIFTADGNGFLNFVGGKLLVEAVTSRPAGHLVLGNYPEATLLPSLL